MLKGIDISQWQGEINPARVANENQFVIVRASYGSTIVDSQGWRNRTLLRQQQTLLGHYHYAEPRMSPAPAQARAFLDSVGWRVPGEILALDIEVDDSGLVEWARNFAQIILNVTGNPPYLYTSPDYLRRYNWTPLFSMGCPLWLASWGIEPGEFEGTSPWQTAAIHQYSSQGSVDGINGNVDMDQFQFDADAWLKSGMLA